MYEPFRLSNTDPYVHDRIDSLYTVAGELRAGRRGAGEQAGLLARTRILVGRRLISIGSTVAGQHA
jgi:hypothetical protein